MITTEKQKELVRKWRLRNKQKCREYLQKWRAKHPEKKADALEYQRAWVNKNREHVNERARINYKIRAEIKRSKKTTMSEEDRKNKIKEYNRAYARLRRHGDSTAIDAWKNKWQRGDQ